MGVAQKRQNRKTPAADFKIGDTMPISAYCPTCEGNKEYRTRDGGLCPFCGGPGTAEKAFDSNETSYEMAEALRLSKAEAEARPRYVAADWQTVSAGDGTGRSYYWNT